MKSRSRQSPRKRCNSLLKKKIKKNIREYTSKKRYVSRKQAIAISYSQVKKKQPKCKKYF